MPDAVKPLEDGLGPRTALGALWQRHRGRRPEWLRVPEGVHGAVILEPLGVIPAVRLYTCTGSGGAGVILAVRPHIH